MFFYFQSFQKQESGNHDFSEKGKNTCFASGHRPLLLFNAGNLERLTFNNQFLR